MVGTCSCHRTADWEHDRWLPQTRSTVWNTCRLTSLPRCQFCHYGRGTRVHLKWGFIWYFVLKEVKWGQKLTDMPILSVSTKISANNCEHELCLGSFSFEEKTIYSVYADQTFQWTWVVSGIFFLWRKDHLLGIHRPNLARQIRKSHFSFLVCRNVAGWSHPFMRLVRVRLVGWMS